MLIWPPPPEKENSGIVPEMREMGSEVMMLCLSVRPQSQPVLIKTGIKSEELLTGEEWFEGGK